MRSWPYKLWIYVIRCEEEIRESISVCRVIFLSLCLSIAAPRSSLFQCLHNSSSLRLCCAECSRCLEESCSDFVRGILEGRGGNGTRKGGGLWDFFAEKEVLYGQISLKNREEGEDRVRGSHLRCCGGGGRRRGSAFESAGEERRLRNCDDFFESGEPNNSFLKAVWGG